VEVHRLLPLYEQLFELPLGSDELGEEARQKMLERLVIRDVCGKEADSLTNAAVQSLHRQVGLMEKRVASRAEKRGGMLEDLAASCTMLGVDYVDATSDLALRLEGSTGWLSEENMLGILQEMQSLRALCVDAGLESEDASSEPPSKPSSQASQRTESEDVEARLDVYLAKPDSEIRASSRPGSRLATPVPSRCVPFPLWAACVALTLF